MKKCPFCAQENKDDAVICRHCKGEFTREIVPVTKDGTAKKAEILNEAIAEYRRKGWILVSASGDTVQLKKPKKFDWVYFILEIFTIVGAIGYLFAYAAESDKLATIKVNKKGYLVINGKVRRSPGQLSRDEKIQEKKRAQEIRKKVFIACGILVVLLIIVLLGTLRSQ